jgi:putative ubiquitin-RnfH superfamily antitoxin RatB of RatAB toxin-antitoxin module
MAEPALLKVQVCYALPTECLLIDLALPMGATLGQAVQASTLLQRYPHIDLAQHKLGVFGKIKSPESLVRAGDRIELYRPLQADPMESRRRRAQHKAKSKP